MASATPARRRSALRSTPPSPAVAITTIEGGDNLINAAEAAGGIQIGGTAEIGSTLTVNGAAVTVDGTGHWTTSVTPAGQGALAVTAIATDAAGNSSSTTTNLTVDTIAPAVAITSGGGPVNQAAQTITGSGEAGTTINLFDNGSLLQLPTITVDQNGLWSASVTLANGSNSLTATDTDAAGNAGSSSAVTYTLSTVGPTVTESSVDRYRNVVERQDHFERCADRDRARQHRGALHGRRQPHCRHRDRHRPGHLVVHPDRAGRRCAHHRGKPDRRLRQYRHGLAQLYTRYDGAGGSDHDDRGRRQSHQRGGSGRRHPDQRHRGDRLDADGERRQR